MPRDTSVNSYLSTINEFDTTGQYIVVICAVLAFVFVTSSFIYYEKTVEGAGDKINYLVVGRFFLQLSDLFTDLFFNAILYLENRLFLLTCVSISLLLLSYFGSIIVCIIWNVKWNAWREHNADRIHGYLQKYSILLMGFTVISNFYVTVDLLRSKLFYFEAFYFPLTKCEYTMLNKYKFINITLLENVSQIIIQIIYLLYSEYRTVNSIVFISIVVSAFSIFLSIMKCCVNDGSEQFQIHSLEKKFGQKLVIDGSFTIESDKFVKFHAFSHNKMKKCLTKFIKKQVDLKLVRGDSNVTINDISFAFDVYHIENDVEIENQLTIYFILEILHFENSVQLPLGIYKILSCLLSDDDDDDDNNDKGSRHGSIYILENKTSSDVPKLSPVGEMDHVRLSFDDKEYFLSLISRSLNIKNSKDVKFIGAPKNQELRKVSSVRAHHIGMLDKIINFSMRSISNTGGGTSIGMGSVDLAKHIAGSTPKSAADAAGNTVSECAVLKQDISLKFNE